MGNARIDHEDQVDEARMSHALADANPHNAQLCGKIICDIRRSWMSASETGSRFFIQADTRPERTRNLLV